MALAEGAGPPKVDRTLTLKYKPRSGTFKGKLAAVGDAPEFAECFQGQKVQVRHARDDAKVGSARTNETGAFKVSKERKSGSYYAVAPLTPTQGTGECAEAESESIRLR